jgi:ABC-2 type transport system permease protein
MNLRRVAILLGKDLKHGSRSFVFILAVVMPVVMSLVVTLIFGSLFSETPKLGIADMGDSELVALAGAEDSLRSRTYASDVDLRRAVELGAVDMGLVLPQGFDDRVAGDEPTILPAYVWGESLAKNRGILLANINGMMRQIAGQEPPVRIETTALGDAESVPWNDRLLPFVLLYGVMMGGSMVPASLLVDEKQKATLTAVTVTPASLTEVMTAKALVGALLGLVMSIVVLLMNQAFGAQTGLLVMVLALGSVLAALFGLVLGILSKDTATLFATIKAVGILLYAPVVVYMFPGIPQWIGRIFPTYYIVQPVVELSQAGGSWPDIALEVSVLAGIVVLLGLALGGVSRRLRLQAA